jgi:hypothetical protein
MHDGNENVFVQDTNSPYNRTYQLTNHVLRISSVGSVEAEGERVECFMANRKNGLQVGKVAFYRCLKARVRCSSMVLIK